MKKTSLRVMSMIMVCVIGLLMTGCGDAKVINGTRYETKGLFNGDERNPDIHYRIIVGNVVWSIILCETVLFPVYFVGFSIWEPVCAKADYVQGT